MDAELMMNYTSCTITDVLYLLTSICVFEPGTTFPGICSMYMVRLAKTLRSDRHLVFCCCFFILFKFYLLDLPTGSQTLNLIDNNLVLFAKRKSMLQRGVSPHDLVGLASHPWNWEV